MRIIQDMRKGRACHFGADVGFDLGFISGLVEARGAVDAVGVEQCHGWHVMVLAHSDEFLGQGRAFEEAESGAGVKLDVHQLPVPGRQYPVHAPRIDTDFQG